MAKITVILTSARFGGKYMLDLISQADPEAEVLQEVLRKGSDNTNRVGKITGLSVDEVVALSREAPEQLWDRLATAAAQGDRAIYLRAYHYHQPNNAPLWDRVRDQARVVHLIRRNLFDAYCSREVAMKLGKWQVKRGQKLDSGGTIEIPRPALEEFITDRCKQINWARDHFAAGDYHEVFFEDIIRSPGNCLRALAGKIDLPENPVPQHFLSKFDRMRPTSNADLVGNYLDVAVLDKEFF
jgi:hypothetical protein